MDVRNCNSVLYCGGFGRSHRLNFSATWVTLNYQKFVGIIQPANQKCLIEKIFKMNEDTKKIIIRNAHEHNLKSVDVEIPHHSLTVVTGVSGSGKSSLVFDTIFREGERRYLASFSSYSRQFLGKLARPAVNHISGLPPCIAVNQGSAVRNPRSTVGTMTELYDYLRLFFARLGKPSREQETVKLERRLFSFNSSTGACLVCKGLGVEDRVDPQLLIANPEKSLSQGALVITTPKGYIIYSQVTMDVLDRVCRAHGFNVDIPWNRLSAEQQRIVLYGSERIKIPYGKHPLESRLRWSGITAKPREEGYYKGIIPVIENILRVKRNKNILRFARSMPCAECGGTRLNRSALSVTFREENIAAYAAKTIAELDTFFTGLGFSQGETAVGEPIRKEFLMRTGGLKKLGLDYLTLHRNSNTLSTGEVRRIRLCSQVGTGLRGILYILDEPSIGLHPRDNANLLDVMQQLRDGGNTVLVVEHDEDTMRCADRLIDIGPGAGAAGGEILYDGPIEDIFSCRRQDLDRSRTAAFLRGDELIEIPEKRRPGSGKMLKVTGACKHNLKNITVSFKLGALNVVTGVSGAGKSTLVHHVLAGSLKTKQTGFDKSFHIEGFQYINKIIEIDQSPIGRTPRSNPATYTKLFDIIRDIFAALPESRGKGWDKGRFSFNVPGGRCETCEGAGIQQIGMHFLGDVFVTCEECGGRRFNDKTLAVTLRGKNIHDILEMPVAEAQDFFKDQQKINRYLKTLLDLGVGYIALGQAATTLSGGEAQRVKLAAELCRPATGKTLYILDEPSTGLHSVDIKVLLESLNYLVDKGNTVITVEHHPDFIKTADWIIDIGPESGSRGGELVAAGTPEEVARCEQSFTGAFLRQILSGITPQKSHRKKAPAGINESIRLKGVSTHNLKNIDVEIPLNKLTVVTGVSGSGKSSLAFDTLFAEGQKGFLSSFSTYARRLLANLPQADVESSSGLTPTIAVSRKSAAGNPRSTVGTLTEIYDYYRLLFARAGQAHCPKCGKKLNDSACGDCGFTGVKTLLARMFSFNHHQGACTLCKGLGVITVGDPEKLVSHPRRSLFSGAMDGTKTGKFYGDPHGRYTAILQAVGRDRGLDFSLPWQELSQEARDIAMYGSAEKRYTVTWEFKRKNRVGEHTFESNWPGFVNYVNEEYERKHADKRGDTMLPVMKNETCPRCRGDRLKPEFLSVYFADIDISQLSEKTVNESIDFFGRVTTVVPERDLIISEELRREISKRLTFLRDMGLDYLTLDRGAAALSGGEAQRLRLAGQLGSGLTGVTYVLDEPTIGLHSRDTQRLLALLRKLRDEGNTLVVVEHDADIIGSADHIIDLGPGPGKEGGRVVACGSVAEVAENPASPTGRYLRNPHAIQVPRQRRVLGKGIRIKGARANNLAGFNIEIPGSGIIALTGVSGSGKSSLLFDVLAASAASRHAVGCDSIAGFERFSAVVTMNRQGLGIGPLSTPATYTGLFDKIRDLFAQGERARSRDYKKSRFSFNIKGGRCETCRGTGEIRVSMDFLADIRSPCEECIGKRYNEATLECKYNGKNIAEVLDFTAVEALDFFSGHEDICIILERMAAVGLGYLRLGQPTDTLSHGEAQRLKLVSELLKGKKERNLYLFDEPTTGLHFEDVRRLLVLFNQLVESGHTIIVIEHHPDIIKCADWLIDLGPEGGDRGGRVVGSGTPEQVAQIPHSPTGQLLLSYKLL